MLCPSAFDRYRFTHDSPVMVLPQSGHGSARWEDGLNFETAAVSGALHGIPRVQGDGLVHIVTRCAPPGTFPMVQRPLGKLLPFSRNCSSLLLHSKIPEPKHNSLPDHSHHSLPLPCKAVPLIRRRRQNHLRERPQDLLASSQDGASPAPVSAPSIRGIGGYSAYPLGSGPLPLSAWAYPSASPFALHLQGSGMNISSVQPYFKVTPVWQSRPGALRNTPGWLQGVPILSRM